MRDQDGNLAIAKFPRKDDYYNVVVWEAIALELAKQAGVNVPELRFETIVYKTFLVIKRFDQKKDQLIPFYLP